MAAAAAGVALGMTLLSGGALLLYTDEGVLGSAGFLIALALGSVAAGVWVGAPDGPAPSHRRTVGRWMLAIGALVVASFTAMIWLRYPALQVSLLGPPLALVLLMAEPAYAIGALMAALEARQRAGQRTGQARPGGLATWVAAEGRVVVEGPAERPVGRGMAVPALLGTAAGVLAAGFWLVPALPPGPVFLAAALLLAAAGTLEMRSGPHDAPPAASARTEGVVLITGVGGRGQVGYGLARTLLEGGARVVIAGRSEEVDAHAAELGDDCVAVRADLATEAGAAQAVEAARSRWGRLDTVVNAVGGLRVISPLAETTPAEWDDELTRNARTAFLVSRAALPLLRESRGSVVNFASPAVAEPVKRLGAYTAGKSAVVALTRTLAAEESANGVRVNAIAPGMIDTDSNRASAADPDAVAWVSQEEVAAAVMALAGGAGGINGAVVRVEGG